jgi:hypothetical protein
MGVTRTESHEGPEEPPVGRAADAVPPTDEAPTDQLFVGSVGDRCASCGSPLAADQRYCIQCGERRGKSRFAPAGMAGVPPPPAATDRAAPAPGEPPRRRASYGPTLVAGVATLLVAMGVGVEIGRVGKSGNPNPRPAPAQVITVNGGGGAAAAAATTTAASGASPTRAAHTGKPQSKKSKAAAAAAAPKPTQKAVQKAAKAASSVLGGSAGQQNSTVTTGQSCTSGTAGCSGGHFSGTFFGGG